MEPAGLSELQNLILRFINLSIGAAFVALTVMLVVAGIKFITSGGEAKTLQQAWATVTWALLGITFLALAWIVLKLIAAATDVDITKFCIGFAPYCVN